MKKTWKIGTRGSLLALTQCRQTKDLLEQKTGEKFELVIIKTRGDQKTDVPLWQLEGKDFFTRELDEALLADRVDLVVHSYKDLGSERPPGIELAAIGERRFGNDILLISNDNIRKLKNGEIKTLIVGTSSPRRIVNLENNLPQFVPGNPAIKTKMLRGNVNTRIEKLNNGDYHAIVLAMPGLERLAQDSDSKKVLMPLVKDLNFMILPASKFPWAASQGALAIEMHSKHPKAEQLRKILSSIHHQETQQAVKRERKAFNEYGGGCHLAVGVAVVASKNRFVHSYRGIQDDIKIEKLFLEPTPSKVSATGVFLGMPGDDQLIHKVAKRNLAVDCTDQDLFVTSSHVFHAMENAAKAQGIWSAGTKTWEKLAGENYWVNGAADSLGEQQLKAFESSQLLKIMRQANFNWHVLSAEDAHSSLGPVTETYTRQTQEVEAPFVQKIAATSDFFWTSFPQYQAYKQQFPQIIHKRHWCGLGKTYDAFAAQSVNVIAVSGIAEFKTLTQTK